MKRLTTRAAALAGLFTVAACGSGSNQDLGGGSGSSDPNQQPTTDNSTAAQAVCKPDYGAAMRTASLSLTGQLPDWGSLKALLDAEAAGADAQKAVYEGWLDKALASKEFAVEQVRFFLNMFATGNSAGMKVKQNNDGTTPYMADRNCAANYAASLVVGDQPYTYLFQSETGTCPSFNETTGQFTPGNVLDAAGAPVKMVGILNDPGIMVNYASNMAFRRVRFIQETFVCSKFPAETGGTPTPMGAALYTNPWPFTSVTGGTDPNIRVNFQDTSAVICANCHATSNHEAPLFAKFALDTGLEQAAIQVKVPIPGNPTAQLTDWLPATETTAWRFGKAAATLSDFGAAVAADPDVATCMVNRVWNNAFARGDIVRDLATIPADVTAAQAKQFAADSFNVKKLIRNIYTSTDFVSR
jgi:hypothetical protein